MSAASIYLLFAIVAGQLDSASLTTLGEFDDQASCAAAVAAFDTTMKTGRPLAHVFCIAADDIAALGAAAQAGVTPAEPAQ